MAQHLPGVWGLSEAYHRLADLADWAAAESGRQESAPVAESLRSVAQSIGDLQSHVKAIYDSRYVAEMPAMHPAPHAAELRALKSENARLRSALEDTTQALATLQQETSGVVAILAKGER